MAAGKHEYEKIYFFLIVTTYVILALNLYYYSHPLFASVGLTHPSLQRVLLGLREGGVFRSPLRTKAWCEAARRSCPANGRAPGSPMTSRDISPASRNTPAENCFSTRS